MNRYLISTVPQYSYGGLTYTDTEVIVYQRPNGARYINGGVFGCSTDIFGSPSDQHAIELFLQRSSSKLTSIKPNDPEGVDYET